MNGTNSSMIGCWGQGVNGETGFRGSCGEEVRMCTPRLAGTPRELYTSSVDGCGIGISVVPSLPKAVRRVRLSYPALLSPCRTSTYNTSICRQFLQANLQANPGAQTGTKSTPTDASIPRILVTPHSELACTFGTPPGCWWYPIVSDRPRPLRRLDCPLGLFLFLSNSDPDRARRFYADEVSQPTTSGSATTSPWSFPGEGGRRVASGPAERLR